MQEDIVCTRILYARGYCMFAAVSSLAKMIHYSLSTLSNVLLMLI